jgi:3-methyladenine DNA glycosylase/8-oxoguanine DNA glycosylase
MRGLPKKERMRRMAEAWRPYRSIACFYLWTSLDSGKKPKPQPKPRRKSR